MFRPSGATHRATTVAPAAANAAGRRLEGRAVRGVDDDLQAVEPVGKASDEVRDVVRAEEEVAVDVGGRERRRSRLSMRRSMLELDRVGQLAALAGEDLDAVVAPRIVRRRDDDAGVGVRERHEPGDGGRGDDAGEARRAAGGREAAREGAHDAAARTRACRSRRRPRSGPHSASTSDATSAAPTRETVAASSGGDARLAADSVRAEKLCAFAARCYVRPIVPPAARRTETQSGCSMNRAQ